MNNRGSIYRTTLLSCIALIAICICSVAFIGCPEAEQMTDGVIQPGEVDSETAPPTTRNPSDTQEGDSPGSDTEGTDPPDGASPDTETPDTPDPSGAEDPPGA